MLKRFAVCGVSNRAIGMFIRPMVQTFADSCQLVGLLDSDQRRFDVCKSKVPGIAVVPEFRDDQFGQMLVKAKPDTIIVTSRTIRMSIISFKRWSTTSMSLQKNRWLRLLKTVKES